MLCMAGNKVQGLKHFKPLKRRISPWENPMIWLSVKLDFPGIKLPLILVSCFFQFVKPFTHSSRFHSGVPRMGVPLQTRSQPMKLFCWTVWSGSCEAWGPMTAVVLVAQLVAIPRVKWKKWTAFLIHSLILGFKILSRTFLLSWLQLGNHRHLTSPHPSCFQAL